MKYLFFLFFFIMSLDSCRKNINDNSYLLNFSLSNAFILNGSDTFLLKNGYNSDSAEGIELKINIFEGEKNTIERVNIFGNTVTNEDVIRAELLLDEGDPYNK